MDDASLSKSEAAKAQGRKLIREAALVAGKWVSDGAPLEVRDPADESVIGSVPKLSAQHVERAVQAAADAFPAWAGKRESERAELLRRWAESLGTEPMTLSSAGSRTSSGAPSDTHFPATSAASLISLRPWALAVSDCSDVESSICGLRAYCRWAGACSI